MMVKANRPHRHYWVPLDHGVVRGDRAELAKCSGCGWHRVRVEGGSRGVIRATPPPWVDEETVLVRRETVAQAYQDALWAAHPDRETFQRRMAYRPTVMIPPSMLA